MPTHQPKLQSLAFFFQHGRQSNAHCITDSKTPYIFERCYTNLPHSYTNDKSELCVYFHFPFSIFKNSMQSLFFIFSDKLTVHSDNLESSIKREDATCVVFGDFQLHPVHCESLQLCRKASFSNLRV